MFDWIMCLPSCGKKLANGLTIFALLHDYMLQLTTLGTHHGLSYGRQTG